MRELYAEKNSIVYCLACESVLYKITRDIYVGDDTIQDDVVGIGYIPSPEPNQPFECPKCGTTLNDAKIISEDFDANI